MDIMHTMSAPDSGLEIRDRMWLKITIPNAFIGKFTIFIIIIIVVIDKSINNSSVYSTVIMAVPLQEFTKFSLISRDACRAEHKWLVTVDIVGSKHLTGAKTTLVAFF